MAAEEPSPVAEMPNDWLGRPLGSLGQVRAAISTAFPDTDWSDPVWGKSSVSGAALNFNLGNDDPCSNLSIHVYGGGDPIPGILDLLTETGWYAIDTSAGEWVHHGADLYSGRAKFQHYLARVRGRLES